MLRKIIHIEEEKCNGCGLCVEACHEGAISMVNGKAKLLRDDYCDGLGDCLPACPTEAITFEEREAAAYDEAAVKEHMQKIGQAPPFGGCPGSNVQAIHREQDATDPAANALTEMQSQLKQWPVQIKLAPVNATYFAEADLLVAADCTAFSHGDFHNRFMRNRITLIGCPKLDEGDYSEKLLKILQENNIKSVTVVRMEVPCCGGIVNALKNALQNCGKVIPWQIATISIGGQIIAEDE